MKSNIWTKRQDKDQFKKKAKIEGFLSRAAYKLIEIENRYKLIKKSNNILEIGSSPGSWSQVILQINQNIMIDAFDIVEMKFKHKNIYFEKKDFFNFEINTLRKKYDLILSDIAPNTTGHKSTDHLRIASLIIEIIRKLDFIANYNSSFITKIWTSCRRK